MNNVGDATTNATRRPDGIFVYFSDEFEILRAELWPASPKRIDLTSQAAPNASEFRQLRALENAGTRCSQCRDIHQIRADDALFGSQFGNLRGRQGSSIDSDISQIPLEIVLRTEANLQLRLTGEIDGLIRQCG